MNVLIGLVIVVIGAINTLSPETGWYLSSGWKFRDAEPSDAALLWTRVSGIATILIGLFFLFAG